MSDARLAVASVLPQKDGEGIGILCRLSLCSQCLSVSVIDGWTVHLLSYQRVAHSSTRVLRNSAFPGYLPACMLGCLCPSAR